MSHIAPTVLFVDGHRKIAFFRSIITALENELNACCEPVTPPELSMDKLEADLVIINDETWPHCATGLGVLRHRGIPTLHLADGILEWRNTWENPRQESELVGMPLFQPILADKIACLGRAQARILESWGNAGKCEVTGSPRFDASIQRPQRRKQPEKDLKVLITTARSAGFTKQQINSVKRSLLDLKDRFEQTGSPFQAVWRIAPELGGLADGLNNMETTALADQLADADLLITTPSTVQVEGMMAGIPVALLDYGNRPAYVPAAWSITAQSQMDQTLEMLANPSAERMLYQDMILHDNVECWTPSTPRVVHVATEMIEAGRRCRSSGESLLLASNILENNYPGQGNPEPGIPMDVLHPRHPVFAQRDMVALQAEVGHLRRLMSTSFTQMTYRFICQLGQRFSSLRQGR